MLRVRPTIIHVILLLAIFSPIARAWTRDSSDPCAAIVVTVGPMRAATSGWVGYLIAVRKPDHSTVVGRTGSLRGWASLARGDNICVKLVGTDMELRLPKQRVWTRVIFVRHDLAPAP